MSDIRCQTSEDRQQTLACDVNLQGFYQSEVGRRTLDILRAPIDALWPDTSKERVASLGCGALLLGSRHAVSARMTSAQEVPFSCLVDSKNKPLPDGDFDRVIALHAVPSACESEPLLCEIARVLKGEGRLLMILPRHGGAWAQNTDTPFGKEPAYSPAQIKRILNDRGFFVARVRRALYAPPSASERGLFSAYEIEKFAPWLFLRFGGGVLLIEAQKRVYGFVNAKEQKRRRCADPLLAAPLPI
jgi:SAM-dependent methyltransferase